MSATACTAVGYSAAVPATRTWPCSGTHGLDDDVGPGDRAHRRRPPGVRLVRIADVVHGGGLVLARRSSDANLIEQWDNGSGPSSPPPTVARSRRRAHGVACTGVWSCAAVGDTPDDTPMLTEALSVEPGYWMAASDGGIFAFGSSAFYGSMAASCWPSPSSASLPRPTAWATGRWRATRDLRLRRRRLLRLHGRQAPQPADRGHRLDGGRQGLLGVARDGGIFAFGDAGFYGSMGAKPLNQPIVGIASTADGLGYWSGE